MKFFTLIFLLLFLHFLTNAQGVDVFFAKTELIQLAPPQLKCGPSLFRNSSTLGFEFDCPNAEIMYSINNEEWEVWTEEIFFNHSCSIRAKAVHPDFRESEIMDREFFRIGHDISEAELTVYPKPNAKYLGNGEGTLIDAEVGGLNFHDGWLGFQSDTINFNLELNNDIEVNSITLHVLNNHGAWIFGSKKIEVFSNDELIGVLMNKEPSILEGVGSQFLKIDVVPVSSADILIRVVNFDAIPKWHLGAGNKPWFFIDEILLN